MRSDVLQTASAVSGGNVGNGGVANAVEGADRHRHRHGTLQILIPDLNVGSAWAEPLHPVQQSDLLQSYEARSDSLSHATS